MVLRHFTSIVPSHWYNDNAQPLTLHIPQLPCMQVASANLHQTPTFTPLPRPEPFPPSHGLHGPTTDPQQAPTPPPLTTYPPTRPEPSFTQSAQLRPTPPRPPSSPQADNMALVIYSPPPSLPDPTTPLRPGAPSLKEILAANHVPTHPDIPAPRAVLTLPSSSNSAFLEPLISGRPIEIYGGPALMRGEESLRNSLNE